MTVFIHLGREQQPSRSVGENYSFMPHTYSVVCLIPNVSITKVKAKGKHQTVIFHVWSRTQ